MIQFGIDRLISDKALQSQLSGKRLGLVGHPASVTEDLTHSIDAIAKISGLTLTCAFGPQHGMKGDKQYNMVESDDYVDPIHRIPIFSLYGKTRRPTDQMLSHCDGVLIDLQDVGCRIYTYLTTLVYMMEACAKLGKFVWVLDRPNPAGRVVEGSILRSGNESFVGVGPIIMRHGLTMGELALWAKDEFKLSSLDLKIIEMKNYNPWDAPGYGWPIEKRSWVNPSPNIPNLSSARCYAGTVMLEGTNLSEGRGTTRPLEGFGAPDIDGVKILSEMQKMAPDWLAGCFLRPFFFEPTFYKHKEKLCSGVQLHVDHGHYEPTRFQPYRVIALALKAIRKLYPSYDLWRNFPYEYVMDRLAIDVITGCDTLRKWVDDPKATVAEFDAFLLKDEESWSKKAKQYYLY